MGNAFNIDEFLTKEEEPRIEEEETVEIPETIPEGEELDIQKAVVEELAADKASLELKMASLDKELSEKKAALEELMKSVALKEASISALSGELAALSQRLAEPRTEEKEGPTVEELESHVKSLQAELNALLDKAENDQPRNPNALALLDRDVNLPDRFPGETRDHVLEVIAEARAAAEKDGRLRRAQILESVLVANEPNGELARRRTELAKLFAVNNNLLSGEVLEELKKRGISHKSGEEYLLPSEIMKRTY